MTWKCFDKGVFLYISSLGGCFASYRIFFGCKSPPVLLSDGSFTQTEKGQWFLAFSTVDGATLCYRSLSHYHLFLRRSDFHHKHTHTLSEETLQRLPRLLAVGNRKRDGEREKKRCRKCMFCKSRCLEDAAERAYACARASRGRCLIFDRKPLFQ